MSRVGFWEEPNPERRVRRKRNQASTPRKSRGGLNQRKLPGKLKWGLFLVLGLGFLVITWWYPQYQEIQEMNNRVADLEWKKLQMKATNQDLQDEITWLGTDAAIERLAREELGLVKPGERVLIDLQSTGN